MSWQQGIGLGLGAVGAGSSIATGLAGKDAADEQTKILQELASGQAGAASGLLKLTAPLRVGVADTLSQVLQGGRPAAMSVFAPVREALEAQYGNARESIIGSGVRGGQMKSQLAETDRARAGAIGNLEADVTNRALTTAGQIGFNVPGVAFNGMQLPASIFGNLANQGFAQQAGAGQGLGQMAAIGTLAALKQPTK